MKVINPDTYYRIARNAVILILLVGLIKGMLPNLFLKKIEGPVQQIEQKYGDEGEDKIMSLYLGRAEKFVHHYVNKRYLPSPNWSELKEQQYLVTYIPKWGKSRTFYGLELKDGTVLQNRRWDLILGYYNQQWLIWGVSICFLAGYFFGKKRFSPAFFQRVFLIALFLAFVWGKLHWFLMLLLIIGLLWIGKRISDKRETK